MGSALQGLENLYMFLTVNLSVFLKAYPVDPQKSQFTTAYAAARSAYLHSVDKIFHDDDPQLQALVAAMKTQQAALAAEIATLSNVAKILTDIGVVVQVAGKIAATAA